VKGAAAAAVVAVTAAGVFVASRREAAPGPRAGLTLTSPSSSSTSPQSSRPSGSATDGTRPGATASPAAPAAPAVPVVPALPGHVAAVPPGWTTVVGRERVAFDVPSSWTVEDVDALVGFETHSMTDAPQLAIMHDVASYQNGACPHLEASSRGRAGFVAAGALAGPDAAAEISEKWAYVVSVDSGGERPRLGATSTTPVLVGGGTIAAVEATTILTITHPRPCQAPAMAFTAVSFQVAGQLVVFMLYTDEGVADSLRPDVARRILASLRPVVP